MIMTRLLSLLALVATTSAATVPQLKLSGIYAYGTDIPGLPVYTDGNGLAVIADETAANISSLGLTNVTWTIDAAGEAAWNVSTTTNRTGSFYIVPADDAYAQAGFTLNGTAPADAVTFGFLQFGSDVIYQTGSDLLDQFWAQNSSSGTWSLKWNSNGSSQADSVPITLKTTAPVEITT